MGAKRAPTGAKKLQTREQKPPSEVDVSELVFSSGEETEGDSDAYHSENSDSEADVEGEIEHAVKDYVHSLRKRGQARYGPAVNHCALEWRCVVGLGRWGDMSVCGGGRRRCMVSRGAMHAGLHPARGAARTGVAT